jgi:hypothetical protein
MPVLLLIIGILIILFCIILVVVYLNRGKTVGVKNNGRNGFIFVLSLISLAISLKLFWNIGVYADEFGLSPAIISGGWFWLVMDWLRLGLLFLLCLISGITLIKSRE